MNIIEKCIEKLTILLRINKSLKSLLFEKIHIQIFFNMRNIVVFLYMMLIHIDNTINIEFYTKFVESEFKDFRE